MTTYESTWQDQQASHSGPMAGQTDQPTDMQAYDLYKRLLGLFVFEYVDERLCVCIEARGQSRVIRSLSSTGSSIEGQATSALFVI